MKRTEEWKVQQTVHPTSTTIQASNCVHIENIFLLYNSILWTTMKMKNLAIPYVATQQQKKRRFERKKKRKKSFSTIWNSNNKHNFYLFFFLPSLTHLISSHTICLVFCSVMLSFHFFSFYFFLCSNIKFLFPVWTVCVEEFRWKICLWTNGMCYSSVLHSFLVKH